MPAGVQLVDRREPGVVGVGAVVGAQGVGLVDVVSAGWRGVGVVYVLLVKLAHAGQTPNR